MGSNDVFGSPGWVVFKPRDKYGVDEKITVWPLQDVKGLAGFINSGNTK